MGKRDADGTPTTTLTEDGVGTILKGVSPISTPPALVTTGTPLDTKPVFVQPDRLPSLPVESPKLPLPVMTVPTFGPPASPITTEQILGRPILTPQPALIPPPSILDPTNGSGNPQKQISDPLANARRLEDSKSDARRKSDGAIGRLMSDYPSTRMVHVRLQWRDPVTRSYHKKGRVKNVSINEVRDPESWCEGPDGVMFGGDWVMGYMPADQGKHMDDPKAWYEFDFDRDGPEPPNEWTIDQPRYEKVVVEVEGMGQIALPELTKLIEGTVAGAIKQAQAPQIPPVPPVGYPGQPGYAGPGYYGQSAQVAPQPVVDPRAEAREKKLEEALEEQRKQNNTLLTRFAEQDRQRAEERAKAAQEAAEARARTERVEAEARHKAELDALKGSLQSSLDQTTRALEAITAKLSVVEQRAAQPPPPPPRDDVLALTTIKDIFTGNRQAEADTTKAREAALADERRREKEDRDRQREEERIAREREREEARERREREREEDRQRREDERTRREAADREASRTLDLYRSMGEQSMSSARAIAEITGKQQDPAPVISMMGAMANQTQQNAQILLTLFKNLGQGGGGGGGVNWAELVAQLAPEAFRAVSDFGAAWVQSSAEKAKIAQAAAAAAVTQYPPQHPVAIPRAVPAQAPSMAGMTPPQPAVSARPATPPRSAPAPQPSAPTPQPTQAAADTAGPLQPLIDTVNTAVKAREPAESVAGKFTAIVRLAQEFGAKGQSNKVTGALRALQEDPLKFLTRAYPSSDRAYLESIAKILLDEYGPTEDEEGNEDMTQEDEAAAEAQLPKPQASTTTTTPAPVEPSPTAPPEAAAAEIIKRDWDERFVARNGHKVQPAISKPSVSEPSEPPGPTAAHQPSEAEMLAAMTVQHEAARLPPAPSGPTEEEMLAAMARQNTGAEPVPTPTAQPAAPVPRRRVRVVTTGPDGQRRELMPPETDAATGPASVPDNGNGTTVRRRRRRLEPPATVEATPTPTPTPASSQEQS